MDAECGDGESISRLAKRLWSNKRALEKFDPSIVVDLAILMQKGEVLIRQAFLDFNLDMHPYPETFQRDVAWVNPRWECKGACRPPHTGHGRIGPRRGAGDGQSRIWTAGFAYRARGCFSGGGVGRKAVLASMET